MVMLDVTLSHELVCACVRVCVRVRARGDVEDFPLVYLILSLIDTSKEEAEAMRRGLRF